MSFHSLRGFINSLKLRIVVVMRGVGIVSKTRLFCWALLDSIPRAVMKRALFLRHHVKYTKNRLVKNVIINLGGSKFKCIDIESLRFLSPKFESWVWGYLNLKEGDVFVDVGANIGRYTISVAKIVGNKGLVIAVEPYPENYKTLVKNVRLNDLKNVVAVNIAAWSRKRELKLFIGNTHGHHSVKKNFGLGSISVQGEALDDVLNKLGVEKVDFIKIDVEGAELEVLKGLTKTLEKYNPTVIVEIQKAPEKVREFISRKGYSIQLIRMARPQYYVLKPFREP